MCPEFRQTNAAMTKEARMRRKSLYKYFSEPRWAEEFINGKVLFRSLSYFRDYEDTDVRKDQNEGTSIFRPGTGLTVNNITLGTTFKLSGFAFVSEAKQEEIFVFCLSRSFTDKLPERFKAVACVEILNCGVFCDKIQTALRPEKATFPGRPGCTRIGHRVEYYQAQEEGNSRWALPDRIAISKLDSYSWQDEFRLVFSLTDALGFENVATCLKQGNARKVRNSAEHHSFLVNAGSLRDICQLRRL